MRQRPLSSSVSFAMNPRAINPKSYVLAGLALCAFLSGAMGQYMRPGANTAPSDIWFIGASVLLVFLWYWLDTMQRSYRRTPLLNFGVIALGIVALPYYFFRSRGAKGGFIALLLSILTLLFLGFVGTGGQWATYYALQS